MNILMKYDFWDIVCLWTEIADWLWDDFDIHALMNKQAICVVKNCDADILEETATEHCSSTALGKEVAWIVV